MHSKNHVYCVNVEEDTDDQYYAFTVNSENRSSTINKDLGGVELDILMHSGATSNIIHQWTWEKRKSRNINHVSKKGGDKQRLLFTYASEDPLGITGSFKHTAKVGKLATEAEFVVIAEKASPC